MTPSTATLIDNILVNSRLYELQQSCVLIHDISDHLPSLLIIKDVWIDKREPKKVLTQDINDCKLSTLKGKLLTQNWLECYSLVDPTEQYSYFMNKLNDMLNEHIPIRQITIPVKKLLCEPWLTKGLRKCKKNSLNYMKKPLKVETMSKWRNIKNIGPLFRKSSGIAKNNTISINAINLKIYIW